MSLQFLMGKATGDHQGVYIQKALDWLQADPQNQVFFLVPNYSKFEREHQLLSALKKAQNKEEFASLNAQVFSFDRLAWFYLQQTGLLTKNTITATGSAMLMRKVLLEVRDELVLYQGEADKTGFIQQLLDLQKELQTGNAQPQDLLMEGIYTDPVDVDRQLKFRDLSLILTRYQEALAMKGLQESDPIGLLTKYLRGEISATFGSQPDLKRTLFIVTGFQEMYAQELALMKVLMSEGHLLVSLLLLQNNARSELSPLDLFFDTAKIYQRLKQEAIAGQIEVGGDLTAPENDVPPFLQELEACWRLNHNQGRYQRQVSVKKNVHLWQVVSPEEEVRQVATQIRKLVATGHYRYQDIQVLTADVPQYGELIPYLFPQYEIPYYLDEQRSMEQHPLTYFLQSLLALEEYHYRLEDILGLLKTELYVPDFIQEENLSWTQQLRNYRDLVDQTENLALKYNFQGSRWLSEKDWQFVNFDYEEGRIDPQEELQRQSNRLRQAFREDIAGFLKKLKRAVTCRDAVIMCYEFLQERGISDQLLAWRDADVTAGRLEAARNHEQTWQSLMNLLDEYLEIYQDDAFDFSTFRLIFTTGLQNSVYGRIPTSLDQVKINQLSLARQKQAKITFGIGLDEKTFPQSPAELGLLNSEDREKLNQGLEDGQFINDGTNDSLAKSPMIAYKAFLSATDQLVLSFASNQDSEQNIGMSPYLQILMKQLGLPLLRKQAVAVTDDPSQTVVSYRSLVTLLNQISREDPQHPKWRPFYEWLKESRFAGLAEKVFASLHHQNVPVPLQPQLAQALYGQDLYSSVSRMESFYECQYRYFADFGLKLRERDIYGLDSMVTGTFFHDALDQFLKAVFQQKLTLQELSLEAQERLVDEVMQRIFGEPQFQILESSARMKYLRYRLSKTVKRVTTVLQKQSQRMKLSPVQTEILFGQIAGEKGIPGLELPLATGGTLHVRGKIDRIDLAEADGQAWLSVVDYKSGAKTFDVGNAYYGLAMQLLTYLDVALLDAAQLVGRQDAKPGGAYYMQIQDPLLKPEKATEEDLLKEYRFNGFFLSDQHLMEQMAPDLNPSTSSALFPLRALKEGVVKASGKKDFFQEEEIQTMMAHNRQLLKAGGEQIVGGSLQLNPYRESPQKYACRFCAYRSVCGFDVMLKENNYRQINNLDKETALEKMMEDLSHDA